MGGREGFREMRGRVLVEPKSSAGDQLWSLGGLRRSPLAVRRRFDLRCHGCRDKEIHNLCTSLCFAPFEISTTNLLL